jgi:hypothetical protein
MTLHQIPSKFPVILETVPQIFVIITFTTQKCEMTQNHFSSEAKNDMGQEGTLNFAKTINRYKKVVTLRKPQITCTLIVLGTPVLVSGKNCTLFVD